MNTSEIEIRLDEYLEMGGDINKVEWDRSFSTFKDSNYSHRIVSFEDKGDTNVNGAKILFFTFENGNTRSYCASWIALKIDVVLHPKYKVKNLKK